MNMRVKNICVNLFLSESAQTTTEYTVLIIALIYVAGTLRVLGYMMMGKMGIANAKIVAMGKVQ